MPDFVGFEADGHRAPDGWQHTDVEEFFHDPFDPQFVDDIATPQIDDLQRTARLDVFVLQLPLQCQPFEALVTAWPGQAHQRKVTVKTESSQVSRAERHGLKPAGFQIDMAEFAFA